MRLCCTAQIRRAVAVTFRASPPPNSNTTALSPYSTMSNFQSILDALNKYAEQTGIDLKNNPFADKVKGCDSPDAVLVLLQENVKAFKDYRDKNRKFIDCLSPVVQFVHAFSGFLGEAASLVSRESPCRRRGLSKKTIQSTTRSRSNLQV